MSLGASLGASQTDPTSVSPDTSLTSADENRDDGVMTTRTATQLDAVQDVTATHLVNSRQLVGCISEAIISDVQYTQLFDNALPSHAQRMFPLQIQRSVGTCWFDQIRDICRHGGLLTFGVLAVEFLANKFCAKTCGKAILGLVTGKLIYWVARATNCSLIRFSQ